MRVLDQWLRSEITPESLDVLVNNLSVKSTSLIVKERLLADADEIRHLSMSYSS